MRITKFIKNRFLNVSKRSLTLWIFTLVFFISAVWIFFIYRANKSIDQLKSDDWQVREQAAKNLSKFGKPAVGPLITALKDEDWDIRWRAAKSLGEIGDSRAIESLTDALKDEDRRVRYRAIEALEKIGGSQVIEPLNSALKDEDIDIRERAVRALEKIGKPAIESLIIALRDEDGDIQEKAFVSLIRVTGENFGIDHEKWQEWWEENKDSFTTQK